MKRVLISGGAGFIGSHLCERILLRTDIAECLVIDNLWTGLYENIEHIDDDRLIFMKADVEKADIEGSFDEIYHLASPASPCWYMSDPKRTISANVLGALHLLNFIKPDGRFCYTSTSEVYGDPLVTPQPETYRGSVDCTGPRSSYDEAKRCTEALLFEMQRTQGLDVRVARLFNVYGPRTRFDDGRAVSNFITQAMSGGCITIYGSGEQSRSWGYIDDIIDGITQFFFAENIAYKGPLNIGNNREISVIEVARFVAALAGGAPIAHGPPAPQDPTNRCPDLKIANEVLPGWACQIPYETGVEMTFNWFLGRHRHRVQDSAHEPANDRAYPFTNYKA